MNILDLFLSIIKGIIHEPFILILLILCILIKIYYPKIRGFFGEFWVKTELWKLPKEEYIILNDIMLECAGATHQIDHIVLSKYGIFVIEMKNYYGLITGSEYKSQWCQHLGKKKFYFSNPIHQNYGHIKALSEVLNINEDFFISIVCFSNQSKLKVDTKTKVTYLDYLTREIKKYNDNIIDFDIYEVNSKLLKFNVVDKIKRKNHVTNIKAKISNDKEKVNSMICPKCGGNLVQRNSRYGLFVGCSNYPKCKYIKK